MLSVKYSWNKATTSSKSTWDTVLYFALNGLSMILCLRSPLHPLSKLLVIQDHAQNFEEQLWMGRRREVSVTSHRPVTSCYLEQERSFFVGVSQHLQLVVALDCFIFNKLKIRITLCLIFIKLMLKCVLNCCCTRGLLQESLLCQFVNIVVTVTVFIRLWWQWSLPVHRQYKLAPVQAFLWDS